VEFYGDSTIKPKENGDLTTINGDFMVISGGIRVSCVFLKSGWWLTYPSEKYEFVSWDDEIPNIWKNQSHG
jgi:hypothetical protein